MTCDHCDQPVYGHDNHPCCELWAGLQPGRPCQGCAASAHYWATHRTRRTPTATYVETPGFQCSTCGLSDDGHARLLDLGFTPHPCRNCQDHYATLDFDLRASTASGVV